MQHAATWSPTPPRIGRVSDRVCHLSHNPSTPGNAIRACSGMMERRIHREHSSPQYFNKQNLLAHLSASGSCRYCCKSPKIPGAKFFERNEAHYDSLINMAPRPLAKPPVSLSRGDEVPHIFIRESHQRARKILISSGKRLLQQNRHKAACLKPMWRHVRSWWKET